MLDGLPDEEAEAHLLPLLAEGELTSREHFLIEKLRLETDKFKAMLKVLVEKHNAFNWTYGSKLGQATRR